LKTDSVYPKDAAGVAIQPGNFLFGGSKLNLKIP